MNILQYGMVEWGMGMGKYRKKEHNGVIKQAGKYRKNGASTVSAR